MLQFVKIVFLYLLSGSLAAQSKFEVPTIPVGYQVKNIRVSDINGDSVSIVASEAFTLIDFYFNACQPCNANIPKLKKLQAKHGNNLNIISVNYIDPLTDIKKHQEKYQTSFISIFGAEARKIKANLPLPENTMGFPFYVLIDKTGAVLYNSINTRNWYKKISNLIKE